MKRRSPAGLHAPEDQIQAAVCLHLAMRGVPGLVWWHTPNGGARSKAEAGRFKALGVKAGVPDIIAVHRGRMYALELKADGGRVSAVQSAMLAELKRAGVETAVAVGIDEALVVLERWGVLRTSRGGAGQGGVPAAELCDVAR